MLIVIAGALIPLVVYLIRRKKADAAFSDAIEGTALKVRKRDLSDTIGDSVVIIMMGAVLGFVVSGLIGLVVLSGQDHEYKLRETNDLVALQDSSSTGGKFFLGSGTLNENLAYVYYYQDEKGAIHLSNARADRSVVYEEDREDAVIRIYTSINRSSLFYLDLDSVRNHYEFRVPEGTVKRDFSLNLGK